MHFRILSSLNIQRKTKRHVFLLLFVLTPAHLNWPSYANWKCYRSPRQLIPTMKNWWLYITIHSLTIFKWNMRYFRLNLIYMYLLFFVQYKLDILSLTFKDSVMILTPTEISPLFWVSLFRPRPFLFRVSLFLESYGTPGPVQSTLVSLLELEPEEWQVSHSYYSMPKTSLRKFFGRYGDLEKAYEIPRSKMISDIRACDWVVC